MGIERDITEIIEQMPGINRKEIVERLGNQEINDRELTNALTTLRRRGTIENRGTRKFPLWYRTEQPEAQKSITSNEFDFIQESEERLRRSLEHIATLPKFK